MAFRICHDSVNFHVLFLCSFYLGVDVCDCLKVMLVVYVTGFAVGIRIHV